MRFEIAIATLKDCEFKQKLTSILQSEDLREELIPYAYDSFILYHSSSLNLCEYSSKLLSFLEDEEDPNEMGSIVLPEHRAYLLYYGNPKDFNITYDEQTYKNSKTGIKCPIVTMKP